MSIDWFTFAAQIANFLLLVWLLKRFLYGPVTRAMEERQRLIQGKISDADAARADAEHAAAEHRSLIAELQHTREELLAQAGREVDDWRDYHTNLARTDIDSARSEWIKALEREKTLFTKELRQQAVVHVRNVAQHILQQLASTSLEEQIVAVFLERLSDSGQASAEKLSQAAAADGEAVCIRTALELSPEQQSQIREAVRREIAGLDDSRFRFVTDADLICGIELQTAGFKLAWTAAESLESLHADFQAAIERSTPNDR